MAFSPALSVSTPAFTAPARRLLWLLSSRPGLVVIYGHPQSSRLAHYFLAAPLLRREAVLFLDAANCFNPFRLASFARRWQRSPQEFLRRIYISRAFTCFQLAELIERTGTVAQRYGARRIVLTGLPDIFDDEELSVAEAQGVFRRSLSQLRRWPGRSLTALLFSDTEPQGRPLRLWLHRQLVRQATAVYRLEESPVGLALREEKRPPRARTGFSAPLTPGKKRAVVGRTLLSARPAGGSAPTGEEKYGSHHRHLSPVDRANPGALRSLPARPAPRRPGGF